MGCDIHFYVERKHHKGTNIPLGGPVKKKGGDLIEPAKVRAAIVSGTLDAKDADVRSIAERFNLTDRTPDMKRAMLLKELGLAALTEWEFVAPPERDLTRWPRETRDDGFVSPFWGPNGCMYETKCYGYTREGADGEWEEVECSGADCPRCHGHKAGAQWYHNRNYELFGILAGVRRSDLPKIAETRGVPADVTAETLSAASWDHTPSWLTVAEVLAYDWNRKARHSGILSVFPERGGMGMESFEEWMKRTDGKSSPAGYCQGRGGRMVTVKEAKALVAGIDKKATEAARSAPMGQTPIVRVEWTETTRDSAPDFLAFVETFIEPMLGPEFAQIKSVLGDALEGSVRKDADADVDELRRDWLRASPRADLAPLRTRALELASEVRFVFGFDS